VGAEHIDILIVDDEPAHAEAVRRALTASDPRIRVALATTLEDFRQKVARQAPDLAIMDLNLPDGRAVQVMTSPPENGLFPILLMTSFGNEQVAVEAIKSGAIDYVVKSQEAFAAMPRTVERALREWGLLMDRKRVELGRRESEARFHTLSSRFTTLLDALPDLFILFDTELQIIWSNKAAAATGRETAAPGSAHLPRLCQRDTPCAPCLVAQSIQTGEATVQVVTNADGRVQELRAIPIKEEGRVVSVIEVCRDISEQRKMEEQLRQTQKMDAVGRLAGGVAHDFNNALLVILGYTDLTLAHLGPDTPVSGYLQEVMNAANRSAELTKQLLALSRKQVVVQQVLDVNQVIQGQMKMLGRLIGEEITLHFDPCPGLWPALIDSSQMDQILLNLVINARDAINGVGTVSIETANAYLDPGYCRRHPDALPGEYLRICVSDTGCGMDATTLERLFEPFFTTKAPGKGTGLGLATVYGVVTQNSGEIHAESDALRGTRFTIHLPRSISEQPAAVHHAPARLPVGAETILLVEDNQQSNDLTKLMLEQCGYTVITTRSPQEACEIGKGSRPGAINLLLSDVIMPELNGRQLSDRITALVPGIKTLFMSGYTEDIIGKRGIIIEGINFIHKPFILMELAEKVRRALDE
jgi:signal transduction histidine kinase